MSTSPGAARADAGVVRKVLTVGLHGRIIDNRAAHDGVGWQVEEDLMSEAIATFFGDDEFPVTFEDGQRELLWVHDDLHIPNPVSPMYADIGGWWLKCDYMFRRYGTPFASDWSSKGIHGYVYTAAIPAETGLRAEASEYGARYTPRTPLDDNYAAEIGGYLGWTLPYYAENFLHWWRDRLVPE